MRLGLIERLALLRRELAFRGLGPTLRRRFRRLLSAGVRNQEEAAKRHAMLQHKTIEGRFLHIYHSGYWNSSESVSGVGSGRAAASDLVAAMPGVIQDLGVTSILDAPCGDCYWMRDLFPLFERKGVSYVGADIVRPLVESLNAELSGPLVEFRQLNICEDPLPGSDLMLVRDCLFHLSYADIRRFFENLLESQVSWILTTSHSQSSDWVFANRDIESGDFRPIDLRLEPFSLPEPLRRIPEPNAGFPPRSLFLYRVEDLRSIINRK